MYAKSSRNPWALFLVILAGLVLGSFIGHYMGGIDGFEWLKYGQEFGIKDPISLELGIIKLKLSLLINLNISGVIGVALAIFFYKKMSGGKYF